MVRYEDNPGTESHEYRPYDRHEDRFDPSRTNGGTRGRFGRAQWDEEWRRSEGRSARPYGEESDTESVDRWRNEGGSQPTQDRGRHDWRSSSGGSGSDYGSRGYTGSGSMGQGYGSRGIGERGGYGGGSGYGHREVGGQLGDNWRSARPGESGGGYSGAGGFGGAGGYGAMPGGQVSGEFTTGHPGYWNRDQDRGQESRGGWGGSSGTMESHRGKGPKGYRRSDDRIREDVCDALTEDARIDASSVEIDVSSGEVKLSGTIGSREDKRRIEDLVERVSGVRDVQNNIKVQADKGRDNASDSSSLSGSSSPSNPSNASASSGASGATGATGASRNR